MDMRIPPLNIKHMFDSNPLKSRILVRRLAASEALASASFTWVWEPSFRLGGRLQSAWTELAVLQGTATLR